MKQNRTHAACQCAILWLALLAVPAASAAPAPAKVDRTIQPRAKQVMRQMSDFLAGLNRFRVHVDTVAEEIEPTDLTLISDRSSDFYVQRPNRLRVNAVSATRNLQFFFNGQNASLYTPRLNYYANWPAPPSIDGLLDRALQRYGLSFPATDFIRQNPYQVLMKNVKSGAYVGPALIHGAYCHHLSFRQPDVDWQIWIEDSKTPYPRRLAIYDRSVEGKPAVWIGLSGWNASPDLPDALFTFTPPQGATKIRVLQTRSQ